MTKEEITQIAHDLTFGKFLNQLIVKYKDIELTDGQLYTLYRNCDNSSDFEEIIKTGASELLP